MRRRLLRRPGAPEATPRALATRPGSRVELRDLVPSDRDTFLAMVRESRELHRPWTYPPERADQFDDLFARSRRDDFVCLVASLTTDGSIVGVFTISQIVRGAFQSAYLGYYAFTPHAHQGLMREGLARVLDVAFTRLELHRLEANIQPANKASTRLVRALGFRHEGRSPRYLKISGHWRDHDRWALLAEDWHESPRKDP